MLARLAHATGSALRIAAPGISEIDLGGAAWQAADACILAGLQRNDVTSSAYRI